LPLAELTTGSANTHSYLSLLLWSSLPLTLSRHRLQLQPKNAHTSLPRQDPHPAKPDMFLMKDRDHLPDLLGCGLLLFWFFEAWGKYMRKIKVSILDSRRQKKGSNLLIFISHRQRRKEGTFCASETAGIENTPTAPKEQGMPAFAIVANLARGEG
jgi:hypothetical protein